MLDHRWQFKLRYLLPADKTLIVKGPAVLAFVSGEASVLGAPLSRSDHIVIRQEKQVPVEAKSETNIELKVGVGGEITEIDGSSLPKSWKAAAESLGAMTNGIAIIIGPTEVGKSALCTYILNQLLDTRTRVQIIDADIGQADIGPPTTIASSIPYRPVPSLTELIPERIIFVGHTSPSTVQSKVINGIKRMITDSKALVIINTDGWTLEPEAIRYKINLISAIKPESIVAIGPAVALRPILDAAQTMCISAEASQAILPRSRNDRKRLREAAYQRFLQGSTTQTLPIHNLRIQLRASIQESFIRREPKLNNTLVGLLDEESYLHQIGVLTRISENTVQLYSRSTHNMTTLEVGYVKLSTNGQELGYLD